MIESIKEPEMVFVEGGTFVMGDSDMSAPYGYYRGICDEDWETHKARFSDDSLKFKVWFITFDEWFQECFRYSLAQHRHSVTLGDFYIGAYEVTQGLWKEVMGNNPSHFTGDDDLPVETVCWNDTQEFIRKLNEKTGKKYRLPTEAEWEYAALGGNRSRGYRYSGSDNKDDVAWNEDNSGRKTHPVGTKQANELGIYDMCGNVWELVNDWDGEYPLDAQTNPTGPLTGERRVKRGGGWDGGAFLRHRSNCPPEARDYLLGFRLALSP
jgi:formylglycine-generating enzyme required for sulfatase activity